jgi:hypothetical protein
MNDNLFLELDNALTTAIAGTQIQGPGNRFRTRPSAIVIEDSFNNIAFPMPLPIIDTKKYDLPKVIEQYTAMYSQDNFFSSTQTLPWHFTIELVGRQYIIYNTRPLDLRYPLTIEQLKELAKDKKILNEYTENILNSAINTQGMIFILVLGNSNFDVFAKQFYQKLGQFIIGPIARANKFAPTMYNNIIPLNMGKRFLTNILVNYVR